MKSHKIFFAVCAILCAVLPTLAAEKEVNKEFELSSGGQLVLDLEKASVQVLPGTGNTVVVRATIKGSSSFVDNYDIEYETATGLVEITAKNGNSGWSFFRDSRTRVRFEVTVPKQCDLDVKTSGGSITVSRIKGEAHLKTSGGSITLDDMDGDLEAHTSGGSINIEACHGNKLLKTSGGSIKVVDASGDLEAKTSGGKISLTRVAGAVNARTSGGSISIELEGENRGIEAKTSGGSIRLSTASNIKGRLSAKTSGGSVTCDLPVTVHGKMSRNQVEGAINGGGPDITLRTSGGSIKLSTN